VKTSSLGDIILGLQVANTLKQQDPSISFSWVSRRRFQPIVEASGLADRVFTFHRSGGVGKLWRLMRELREDRFDYVLDMQGLARSALMSFAAKSPIRVGRSDAREGATLFYDRIIPLPPGRAKPHAVEILLEFCRVFGLEPKLGGKIEFSGQKGLGASVLKKPEGGRLVMVFPGKERIGWDWSGYAELVEKLLERESRVKVIYAGLLPGSVSERLMNSERFVDMRGKLGLEQAGALVQASDLVISNEVAPLQMAGAVGSPTVGVYGPVDPSRYGPYSVDSEQHVIVRADGGRIEDLPVETVLEATVKALRESCS